jgi:hypothetical protein
MITVNWRFLTDPYFDEQFVILPLTGNLISVSSNNLKFKKKNFFLRILGLNVHNLRDEQFFEKNSIVDVSSEDSLQTDDDSKFKFISIVTKYSLLIFPVSFVVLLFESIFSIIGAKLHEFTRLELKIVAKAFGRRSKDNCLQIAICRYALLRLLGINSTICIGVLVPTEEMHPWVEVKGHPILECNDVLVHYKTCLKYSTSPH